MKVIKGIKVKKVLGYRWKTSIPEFFIGEDGNIYFYDLDGKLWKGEIRRVTKRFVVVRFELPTYRMTVSFYKGAVVKYIKEKA